MALSHGYNVSKAEEVLNELAYAYNEFGSNIVDEWEGVVNTLQKEWIGPDEQDFEKKFAERVSKMYHQAHAVVKDAIDNIVDVTNEWIRFQNTNTLTGDSLGAARQISAPSLRLNEKIVSHKPRTFSDSDDKGLANSNSADRIKSEVKSFAKGLKRKSDNIFDAITTKGAFFGGQRKEMDKYIEAVGITVGEITVAVNDLNTALDALAGTLYKESNTNIKESFVTATGKVEAVADDLGETRWK